MGSTPDNTTLRERWPFTCPYCGVAVGWLLDEHGTVRERPHTCPVTPWPTPAAAARTKALLSLPRSV